MSKRKKEKVTYIDDGRTIANMNVEGMPWYNPTRPKETSSMENLSKGETLAILGGILKASLFVASIFVVVFLIFILFCVFVWFK